MIPVYPVPCDKPPCDDPLDRTSLQADKVMQVVAFLLDDLDTRLNVQKEAVDTVVKAATKYLNFRLTKQTNAVSKVIDFLGTMLENKLTESQVLLNTVAPGLINELIAAKTEELLASKQTNVDASAAPEPTKPPEVTTNGPPGVVSRTTEQGILASNKPEGSPENSAPGTPATFASGDAAAATSSQFLQPLPVANVPGGVLDIGAGTDTLAAVASPPAGGAACVPQGPLVPVLVWGQLAAYNQGAYMPPPVETFPAIIPPAIVLDDYDDTADYQEG